MRCRHENPSCYLQTDKAQHPHIFRTVSCTFSAPFSEHRLFRRSQNHKTGNAVDVRRLSQSSEALRYPDPQQQFFSVLRRQGLFRHRRRLHCRGRYRYGRHGRSCLSARHRIGSRYEKNDIRRHSAALRAPYPVAPEYGQSSISDGRPHAKDCIRMSGRQEALFVL